MKASFILLEAVYLLLSLINYSLVNGACSYTVSGHTIDLSKLSGTEIDYSDGQWTYQYTPCTNGLTCTDSEDVTQTAMADQFKTGNTFCTAYLALWTEVEPTYSDGVFTFTWSNGKSGNSCDNGRTFIAEFSCGSDTATATGVTTSGCDYTMAITSSYACDGIPSGGGGSGSSGDLSPGTIMVIIIVAAIFFYCVIGYIVCAKKNPENGWGNVKANTPHLNFWCLLPKLVWAGCCVSKEFTVNKVNKIRGKGDGSDGAYDTVADGDDI